MNKRYIILSTFFDMGGGQLYVRNKVDYLQKKGWHVDVYTGRSGKLLIPEMEKYKDNYYPELDDFPFYFSRKKREQIINDIIGQKKINETIIESSKAPYAVWGEMLAERVKAKHIFFDLDEEFPKYDSWYYHFADFKHKRREIAGIIPQSMQRMFRDHKIIEQGENYNLKFICQNTISTENNRIVDNIEKTDINLSCISRLDKNYIMPMIREIVLFAKMHREKTISLILVGDAKDSLIIDRLKHTVMNTDNIRLHLLGYLSPIPQSLIDRTDIFIGTSGSAIMTAQEGKITITVDTSTCRPIGILGYDIDVGVFLEKENPFESLSVYLEYLCYSADKNKIIKYIKENNKPKMDYMREFDTHMDFIKKSDRAKDYFQFDDFRIGEHFAFIIVKLIGKKNIRNMKHLAKRALRSWR